tara:strand:+ start:1083 stop:1844 length:762 start_codon:yes stop_codon:yes gene_type:complete
MELNKRGQVAIFVIVAIVIVGLIVLGVMFYPEIQGVLGVELNPQSYLKGCVEPIVVEGVALLSKQGGYQNPEGFIVHDGEKVKYLCYTNADYETCVVQEPAVKDRFESELKAIVEPRAVECGRNLKAEYESRGYGVSAGNVDAEVSIVPDKIGIKFVAPMTITKDTSETFREFDVEIDSEMYELLYTAQSIVDFESEYGDSETTLYLQYYPELKIEKNKLGDGTTIYKLSNVITEEEFTFASRSLAWPPGYGV